MQNKYKINKFIITNKIIKLMIILILILEDIQIKKYQEVQELNIVNQEYK